MHSFSLGLDANRYRLSRDASGLGLYWSKPQARRAAIHGVAKGKLPPLAVALPLLGAIFLSALLSVGGWGIYQMVRESKSDYASQPEGDDAFSLPLTPEEKAQVPKVITRETYEKHHKKTGRIRKR